MGRMIAEEIAEQLQVAAPADPADLDGLDDATSAGRVGKRRRVEDKSLKAPVDALDGRLRLRAGIPEIARYRGKKVARKEAFGSEEEDDAGSAGDAEPFPHPGAGDSEDDGIGGGGPSPAGPGASAPSSAGAFSISGELEAEYEQMMQTTSKRLEIMRTPSASEVAKRQDEAKRCKRQLDAWNALVQFRIHLEGALSLGHQLPCADAASEFREASPAVASAGDAASRELRGLLGELLALQGQLADQEALRAEIEDARTAQTQGEGEAGAWAVVDGPLRTVLDWGLEAADAWKDRTRLEARRGFKVLDQPLRTQMQAVAEVPPEKLRRRCTPPAGRHRVFGAAPAAAQGAAPGAPPGAGGGGAPANGEGSAGGESEIFDDREFYVQLLREVLGDGGQPAGGLGEEAKELRLELQGRRASKKRARADVERRASKGRKIRYVPVEKLQNFMAPRPRGAAAGGPGAGDGPAIAALQEKASEALMRSLFA